MYGIVGLGNPGSKYAFTPHNVGFMVCDLLSLFFNFHFNNDSKCQGLVGKFQIEDRDVAVLKPLTFMNLSGVSVASFLKNHSLTPQNLIVIHDDIDLPLGRLRIRKNSSSGGHRGVESIIEHLGTRDFIRVKIGVGRRGDPSLYVLSEFDTSELEVVRNTIEKAKEAVIDIITNSLNHAMSTYNKKD